MDFFKDLPSLERKSLLYFLVASDVSQSERYHLWRKFIKHRLLDNYLLSLENDLRTMGMIWFPQFRCRLCSGILKWIENNQTEEEDHLIISNIIFTFLDCTACNRSPIMKCNIVNAMKFFTDVLTLKNSQMLISALHLLMISANSLNSISPPTLEQVEDPFYILENIYDNNRNELKYGGGKIKTSILLIDIYECDQYPEYPILYFCDTITVPQRFHFYPLKFRLKEFNPIPKNLSCYISRKRKRPDCLYEGETKFNLYENNILYKNNDGVSIPKYQEEYLLKELADIGNMCIKPGSDVVLGPKIKKYISHQNFVKIRNIKVSVPDCKIPFYELFEPAENICKICLDITFSEQNKTLPFYMQRNYEYIKFKSYDLLSICLISAVWLLLFANTPFETILFHIVCLGLHDKF